MILISIFWKIIGLIGTATGISAIITQGNLFITYMQPAIAKANEIIANVYYFIDKPTAIYLISLGLSMLVVRVVMALVNLVWW